MKTPKTKLGALEMQLLSYAQMRKKDILALGELSPVLSITLKQERELFSRLSRVSKRMNRFTNVDGPIGITSTIPVSC